MNMGLPQQFIVELRLEHVCVFGDDLFSLPQPFGYRVVTVLFGGNCNKAGSVLAGVLHEHKLNTNADVSPYEAWDIFQELYLYGFVPSSSFNTSSLRNAFFGRQRPDDNRVSTALSHLRLLPDEASAEDIMSNRKHPNPFASNQSLERREVNQGVSLRQHLPGEQPLQAPRTNPFSGQIQARESPPPSSLNPIASSATPATQPQGGLPCVTESNMGLPTLTCSCGGPISLEVAGPVDTTEQELMDSLENIELLDVVLYGPCGKCGFVWHLSGGKIPAHVIR